MTFSHPLTQSERTRRLIDETEMRQALDALAAAGLRAAEVHRDDPGLVAFYRALGEQQPAQGAGG